MIKNWGLFKLSEIADIIMGQSPKSIFYNQEKKGLPFFQGKTEFGEYYPKVAQYTSKVLKKASEGDILFTVRAPVGELNVADKDCCIGRGLAAIRAKNNKEQKFLFYLLKTYSDKFLSISNGAVYDAINSKDLVSCKFDIPKNSDERIKIGEILNNFDLHINNNIKIIERLSELTKIIYEEWFLKFRINKKLKKTQQNLSDIPDGWKWVDFKELVDFKEGPGIRNWQYRESGVPFINIRLIRNGEIYFDNINYLDENEVNKKYKHFLLSENDHVISSSGTLGRVSTIRKTHLPLCLNTSVIRMRKKTNYFGTWLIKHTLESQLFQNLMEVYANGSAQQNFGPTHLNQIKILSATKEINLEYEKIVEPIEEKIKKIRDQILILKELKKLFLPRLITGKINYN